jgi:heme A synthase
LKSKETLPVIGAFGVILFLQVFLGINNVLSHLPLWNAVAHNIFGVMLFLCMIVIMYLSFKKVDAVK